MTEFILFTAGIQLLAFYLQSGRVQTLSLLFMSLLAAWSKFLN